MASIAWLICCLFAQGAEQPPSPKLGAEAFARAIREAFAAGDSEGIERLVKANPTRFAPLFERYAQVWMDHDGEPSAREIDALACAGTIAEAADAVFAAPGLLEVIEAAKSLDEDQRRLWHQAKSDHERGVASCDRLAWSEAVELLSRAERAFGELLDVGRAAGACEDLGICHHSQGQHERAIAYHERALALKERIGNPRDIALVLNNLGICFDELSQHQKALQHHERALALFQDIGEPQDIGASLVNLGVCCRALGQYDKEIEYHERALALFQMSGDTRNHAAALNNLGSCYHSLGQYEKAITYHEQALALKKASGSPQEIAHSLANLGSCYDALRQYDKAIQFHERALALREKVGNLHEIATSLNNLGSCYDGLRQYEKAIDYQERSLALKQTVGDREGIARSLHNLGRCYAALGQYEKAIQYGERSLAFSDKFGSSQDIATSLAGLGLHYHAVGQGERSLSCFERAAAEIKRPGLRFLSDEGRAAFLEKWTFLAAGVSGVARVLQGLPRSAALERAFPLVESFFAGTTLEGLQEKVLGVLDHFDPELSQERGRTLDSMVQARIALGKETDPPRDPARTAELEHEIAELERTLEGLDQRLRLNDPKLKELIAPEAATLAIVRKQVLGAADALLMYVLAEKESFAWVVTRETATVLALPGEQTLRDPYERLVSSMSDQDEQFLEPARELFQLLLSPAWALVAEKDNLIVVPDGFLAFLPFELLLTGDSSSEQRNDLSMLPYVLRAKTVCYAPSASILAWLAEHGPSRKRSWQKDLFLLGDPVYPLERAPALTARSASLLVPSRFARLEKTREEVAALAQSLVGEQEAGLFLKLRDLQRSGHVSGSRFDLYVGEEASKERLTDDLRSYRIVHLAVHGFFDSEFPWFSGLVLSDSSADAGFVNLVEIATLRLDAEIVFLSACETARGKVVRADGIRNTARSFLLAGAQSVVATQWNVMDDAAAVLASGFYARLFQGSSAAQALREAKIALLEHRAGSRGARPLAPGNETARRWAHPSFWAPFVIFGR